MKLKYIIEGVNENAELYKLTNLILKKFSNIEPDRWWQTPVYLFDLKKYSNQFKIIHGLFDFLDSIEIVGNKNFYNPKNKTIQMEDKPMNNLTNLYSYLKKNYQNILIHELQHAFDDMRSKGQTFKDKQSQKYYNSKIKTDYDYLKLPHEVWARFAEFGKKITPKIDKTKIPDLMWNIRGWEYLDMPTQQRLLKAAYKLYDLKRNNLN